MSEASTGRGPINLYDIQKDKTITIPIPFSENLGGPISWLGSNSFFLRSWNPVSHGNSLTTDSGFSLIQIDLTSLKVNKLVTIKLTDGAIDRYLVDEINNVIYLSGRGENIYKFNIQTSVTEKINSSNLNNREVFFSETYIPSPKKDKFIAIKDEGMGETSTRVVDFKTLQSKLISGNVTDWYDNDTVIMTSSKVWLMDINTLVKKQLMDFANTSVFAKVRPTLNR